MRLECFLHLCESAGKCIERDLWACDECDDDEESVDGARFFLVFSFNGSFGGGGIGGVLLFDCEFVLAEHVLKDVS